MMKRGIVFLILLLLIPLAFAQHNPEDVIEMEKKEIATTVENRLSLEFHAVSGTDVITLDLPQYFGKDADFVHSYSENVNITIEPKTHIATLRAKDSDWRGIETVVFATSMEYLEEEEKKGILLPPSNRSRVVINVSKEDVALETDAFTQVQFETVLGNLTSEPINMESLLSNESFAMIINDEMVLNISKKGGLDMLWHTKVNPNMTSARYQEYSDFATFSVIIFVLFAVGVLVMYIYFGYASSLKRVLLAPKKVKKETQKKIMKAKDEALKELKSIQRRTNKGKEKPRKLYKECVAVMNKFLASSIGVKGSNIGRINDKLKKMGVQTGAVSKINTFINEHKGKVFSGKELTHDDVNNFITFLKSIINSL